MTQARHTNAIDLGPVSPLAAIRAAAAVLAAISAVP